MTHFDPEAQTEPPDVSENRKPDMNYVLENAPKVSASGSLGEFLRDLFKVPPRSEPG